MTTYEKLWELLNCSPLHEVELLNLKGESFVYHNNVLRQRKLYSEEQAQTQKAFAFKWSRRDTYDSPASLERMRNWLLERYGDPTQHEWLNPSLTVNKSKKLVVVDAGCSSGFSAFEYFKPIWNSLHYIGVDISSSVDTALQRARERNLDAAFVQADLSSMPFPDETIDVIFSEGVLHHTDSTEKALKSLIPLLKKGGVIMFYVYKKKGPIREFTDDYIRKKIQDMSEEDAWKALEPLTKLGVLLGQFDITINIEEPIDILEIPKGPINLQRFFYWHVAKVFYREDHSLDELNHVNFDWYYPKNAHRQTPEEVRQWCKDSNLRILRDNIQESGITIIAQKE